MMLPWPAASIVSPKTWLGKSSAAHEVQIEYSLPSLRQHFAEIGARRQGRIGPVAARRIDQHAHCPPFGDDGVSGLDEGRPIQGIGRLI